MQADILKPGGKSTPCNLLRSPRLAFGILIFMTSYAAAVVWLPWVGGANAQPPQWAERSGLDHPFSAAPFLLSCFLLFVNTLACTVERTRKVRALWQCRLPANCPEYFSPAGTDVHGMLLAAGFRGGQVVYHRYRPALWGGWLFHVGILLLLAVVTLQRAYFDGGAFELTEGESVDLSRDGVVFGRDAGILAPKSPPGLRVTLQRFDPYLHQEGFAPDRASYLTVVAPGSREWEGRLDRSRGATVANVTIYQAIPTGLALNLAMPGQGVQSIHLRADSATSASRDVMDPAGQPARFSVVTERNLDDPLGTGAVTVHLEQQGRSLVLRQGATFRFGPGEARLTSVSRWGGFTYGRSPGTSLVFASFWLMLAGGFLMLFPAGMALLEQRTDGAVLKLYVARGRDSLLKEWGSRDEGMHMDAGRNGR
jgi:hypothetical protein